jgi:flagellar protein FlaI
MAQNLPKEKQDQLLYYVERDFIGLERIEPLMQDPNIEDISCDGVGIPIFVQHRDPNVGSIKTNVVFESAEELDAFVNKLAQRCGKTISVAEPLIDATLPDGSRLQATLGTDIAKRGSNFTIRKFPEEPLTPIHLLKYGTLDIKILAYLWFLIEHRRSILIAGGTATGKTTLLNALSLFIRPEMKIVTIEDTSEFRLPHPHWVPHVARKPIVEIGGKKLGEVDMFDLLRESLRQRPDYIIVGEVRGKETYVLFQQIATGHAGLATIHADSVEKLMDRLTTPPISLSGSLIGNLDVIIFISRIKREHSYIRRITSLFEVVGFDKETDTPLVNKIFHWNPRKDEFETISSSVVLKRIAEQTGLTEREIQSDLGEKIRVLEWMTKRNIINYRMFSHIIKMYYTQRERLFEIIEGG